MTWDQKLRGRKLIPSIFQLMEGRGSQNDRMQRFLEKLTRDKASINDLFERQAFPRELIIYILEQRIRRRLRR